MKQGMESLQDNLWCAVDAQKTFAIIIHISRVTDMWGYPEGPWASVPPQPRVYLQQEPVILPPEASGSS